MVPIDKKMSAEEELVVQRLEDKLRKKQHHGMGAFADSLMKHLSVKAYYQSSNNDDDNDDGNEDDEDDSPSSSSSSSSIKNQQLVLSFPVTQQLCNSFDTLHGGAQATAVDIFTSILLGHVHPVPSVTTDLHVSCIAPAPLGSNVVCHCVVEKAGGKIQFASCDLYREDTDITNKTTTTTTTTRTTRQRRRRLVLVTKGLHTKFVLKQRTKGFVNEGRTMRSKL